MPHEYSPLYSRETLSEAAMLTGSPGRSCVKVMVPMTLC